MRGEGRAEMGGVRKTEGTQRGREKRQERREIYKIITQFCIKKCTAVIR